MAVNWGQGLAGGAGGALGGASALSALGPIGAGVGAAGGGLLGFISSLFGGSGKDKFKRAPMAPEEQQAFDLVRALGMQNLQDPLSGFGPIEQEARSGFQQQTLPSIAERFGGMGQNRLSSPAFRSQQLGAGVDLERSLAAMRSQFGQQNIQNALQQLQFGLTPYSSQFYKQGSPGVGESIFKGGVSNIQPLASGLQDYYQRQNLSTQRAKQDLESQQNRNLILEILRSRGVQ